MNDIQLITQTLKSHTSAIQGLNERIFILETERSGAAQRGRPSATGSADRSDPAQAELMEAIEGLLNIVEGCFGERWAANGKRLVDTPEWCRFYVALNAMKRHAAALTAQRERASQPNND